MKQIPLLIDALSAPLAIRQTTLETFVRVFRSKLGGAWFNGAELHAELGIAAPRPRQGAREAPTVAVIPVQGVIAQHPQSLGTSTDEIGAALNAALVNDRVDAILLDVDSPGGTVGGIPELAAKIAEATQVKPIVALANSMMASAAYWLASQADEVVVTPSGEVGSIGVYMVHEDWSKNLEQEGVSITAISAGKFKTEGAPWEPLGAEAEAFRRARVEEVYGWFVKAVASGRRDSQANVRNGYGEGRVLGAVQAVNAKLADRVGTFEDTVMRLATRVQRRASRGASASLLRRRLTLDSDPLIP